MLALNESHIPQEHLLLAAILIGVATFWLLLKQAQLIAVYLRKFPYLCALVELLIFPAALYGVGTVIQHMFAAAKLVEQQATAASITEFAVIVMTSTGIGKLVLLRIEATSRRQGAEHLSQLRRVSVLSGFILLGLLVFTTVDDHSSTKLYISTGAVAAVLAFAMQQTLGDLFSGIALSVERPFRIGDWLRFDDGTEGQVIDINWRSTHLRGWTEGTYVIPNGVLSRQRFLNLHGAGHPYADLFYVNVSGDADPEEVATMLLEAMRLCKEVLRQPAPSARLMDGSTIPYRYYVWVYFKDYPSIFAAREEIYLNIHRALKSAGLQAAVSVHEIRHRSLEVGTPDIVRSPQH